MEESLGFEIEEWEKPAQQARLPQASLASQAPIQVEVYDKEVSPGRMLEEATPNTIRRLIELVEDAMSERVQLDAIKALLHLAGVGKRDEAEEVSDQWDTAQR